MILYVLDLCVNAFLVLLRTNPSGDLPKLVQKVSAIYMRMCFFNNETQLLII